MNLGGRPLKFKSEKQLQEAIASYYTYCETQKKPLTMCGLAFYLGIDRKTLVNYAHDSRFFPTIREARARVELDQAERLMSGQGNATGIMFSLKNNFDWVDKKEAEVYGRDGKDLAVTVNWVATEAEDGDPS